MKRSCFVVQTRSGSLVAYWRTGYWTRDEAQAAIAAKPGGDRKVVETTCADDAATPTGLIVNWDEPEDTRALPRADVA